MNRDDREHYLSEEEICELLMKAEDLGFSMKRGSEIEYMPLADVERLVSVRQ